ncbi:MAG: M13-type metalloendopeptidase [Gemmatimonadaceae bacterium]
MFSRRISLCAFASLIALATPLRAQAPAQTVPFDRSNLDTTVKACQDFYQFANGGWLTRAKIPGDKWRVNGPLSNMPEFRAAWGCKEGDPMARATALQPRIW